METEMADFRHFPNARRESGLFYLFLFRSVSRKNRGGTGQKVRRSGGRPTMKKRPGDLPQAQFESFITVTIA